MNMHEIFQAAIKATFNQHDQAIYPEITNIPVSQINISKQLIEVNPFTSSAQYLPVLSPTYFNCTGDCK